MFKKMSLRMKLIILFLVVGLISAMSVGFYSYNIASQNIEDEIYAAMDMFGELAEYRVEGYFEERIHDGRVLATTSDVYESLNTLQDSEVQAPRIGEEPEVEEELESTIPITNTEQVWSERLTLLNNLLPLTADEYGFEQIFLTDLQGEIVYDTLGLIEGEDYSNNSYIQGALSGQSTWSNPFYSNVINDEAMILSTPVYSEGISGELVGTVNILIYEGIISDIVHEGLYFMGETADSYLIDANGLLLTDTMLGEYREGAALNVTINTEAVQQLSGPISEGNDNFAYHGVYPDYLGNQVLGALEVLRIGDMWAGLVVEIDYNEAFAGIYELRNNMLVIGLIVSAAVLGIALIFAGVIARPLKGIQEATSRVNNGAENVASSAEEMSASLEEVSASSNQFAANAQTLSSNAQKMSEASSSISTEAEEGNKTIEEGIAQMEIVNKRVLELQEVIGEVDQRSQDIGKILNVITDIADQTNLLALNAAIEAARAGDQGRGFAVVAEEVRKLAEQSASATNEIGDLIKATQNESQKALESMRLGVADVETGTEAVSKTGTAFTSILQAVEEIARQVEETAGAAQELSAGSEEMSASIQEQSATMESVASTAVELNDSADTLYRELQKINYQSGSAVDSIGEKHKGRVRSLFNRKEMKSSGYSETEEEHTGEHASAGNF